MSERIVATYELPGPADAAAAAARAIAFEETVEVPFDFPLPPAIRDGIVGRPGAPEDLGGGRFRVAVTFPAALGARLGTLLNLVYGNASIWPATRLVGLDLPPSVLAGFRGPNHGAAGLRALTGATNRPLLATALKPMGSSDEEFAEAAAAFARGGGDIAKDDQNLVDRDFESFRRRIETIAAAVRRAGARCLYFPHLSGPQEELAERLSVVLSAGLKGVLVCPAIVGLDAMRALAESRRCAIMAHPAYSGTFYADRSHGIAHSLYLGTFMRLAGADITVFPNAGGRFGFTREECRAIAAACRAPLGSLAPALPAPGGGMSLENSADMAADFGPDAVWLVGGRLLMHSGGPEAGARAFRSALEKSA